MEAVIGLTLHTLGHHAVCVTVIHAFVMAFDFAGRAIHVRSHHSVGRIGTEESVD